MVLIRFYKLVFLWNYAGALSSSFCTQNWTKRNMCGARKLCSSVFMRHLQVRSVAHNASDCRHEPETKHIIVERISLWIFECNGIWHKRRHRHCHWMRMQPNTIKQRNNCFAWIVCAVFKDLVRKAIENRKCWWRKYIFESFRGLCGAKIRWKNGDWRSIGIKLIETPSNSKFI